MAGKMKKVSIHIPEPMALFFQKYARNRGISMSRAIRECLTGVLAFLDDSAPSREGLEAKRRFEELVRKAKAEGKLVEYRMSYVQEKEKSQSTRKPILAGGKMKSRQADPHRSGIACGPTKEESGAL